MRMVLFGAPGTGKGTQGEKLAAHYQIPAISTGDLLRAAVANKTELGMQAKKVMDAGELVADDVVVGMIRGRLAQDDTENGFILDGFPRSMTQAEALDEMLESEGKPLDAVVSLEVARQEILNRLLARGRADDNAETINNRLDVFEKQTKPLLAYYEKQGTLKPVDGVGTLDEVFNRIVRVLE